MKIFIAQLNPTVGALAANAQLIRRAYADGVAAGANVVIATELAVTVVREAVAQRGHRGAERESHSSSSTSHCC